MAEIKLGPEGQANEDEMKMRVNLKAAIRLADREEQQIITQLEQFHHQQLIQAIQYDQQKTQLQKYLDLSSTQRSKRIVKSIKAELSYLPAFQAHTQSNMPKELVAIMKRDIDMLTAVISKFVYPKLYMKGSIIDTVATQRQNIKILLKGNVAIYQPINHKSYKNCLKFKKSGQIETEWLSNLIKNFNSANGQSFYLEQMEQKQEILTKTHFNPEKIEESIEFNLRKKHKPLPIQIIKKILARSGIISSASHHRQTKVISEPGQLISSERQPFIINQPKPLQHTAICLTQTYVVELQYNIYKAAISLLNSDQQKKYIQILLRKFQMFEYFDAKEYVKKQYMIDKKREENQYKKKQEDILKAKEQNANVISQFMITRQIEPTQKILREHLQTQKSQNSLKSSKVDASDSQIDIETYEIKYDCDIYLIISGEATIVVDRIGEKRLSNLEHASKIKSFKSHQILKLYTSDIFGFEEIGKIKEYNLRYRVNKSCKILLLSENVYVRHYTQIAGFKNRFKTLQRERNELIATMIHSLQKNIDDQQLRSYQSISNLQAREQRALSHQLTTQLESSLTYNSTSLIRKVEYLGNTQFQAIQNKIKDRLSKQKEGRVNELNFKQMIRSGSQLRESLAFASIYKEHLPKKCEIVGDYIEIRSKDGVLKRKKCIIDGPSKEKEIYRKIGIISAQDKNTHNFALINNRRSKYQLQDFDKQKKEMARLKQISQSLPKLNFFYAKKSEIMYNNIHKREH